MTMIRKIALGGASLALVVTPAMPVMAANVNHHATSVQQGPGVYEADSSDYRRRGRHYRHRDRVDAGDVIAGIGILAGIAIIASAASKSDKRQREQRRYPQDGPQNYPQPYPQDDRQSYPQDNRSSGNYGSGNNDLGTAVELCSEAAESRATGNARVDEIRSVTRDGDGWRVEGDLSGGDARGFSCGATNGQVDFIQLNS